MQWRYCIRLENLGKLSVQLRERHWRIFALSGTLETVRGRGVIGQEPILDSIAPAFQYSSHISLQAPSGHMWYVYFPRTIELLDKWMLNTNWFNHFQGHIFDGTRRWTFI